FVLLLIQPFLQVWRANTDFSPVVDKQTVANYIAKYASKGEKSSPQYKDLMNEILANATEDHRAKQIISSLVIKTIGERDYSVQEVMHLLYVFDMYNSSRQFVCLCLTDSEWQSISIDNRDQSVRVGRSIIQKYRERPFGMHAGIEFDNMSLLHFAKNHYTKNVQGQLHYVTRQKEAIVRVFPRLKLTGDTENDEKYYRLQVILKVPFRGDQSFDDLLRDPDTNIVHETWQSRFESLNIDALEAPELPEAEDEGIVPERLNELDIVEPFMIAAAMVNNQQSINGQPTVGR